MSETAIIIIAAVLVLYFIMIYNRLVALRNNVDEAWSNIDVLLKQRYEEIPKLVEVCKQYMKHEREAIDAVTAGREAAEVARKSGDARAIGQSEATLSTALTSLFARAEAYPDLKAVKTFSDLMSRISVLQDSISDRREYFNEAVNLNNTRRDQFPDLIVSRLFRFGPRQLFEAPASEKQDVDVKSLFQ
mgnify:FL=1